MGPLSVRRIVAWCVDWLIIIGYAAALVPLGLLLRDRSVELSPGASPGKRLLRLRVQTADGSAPPLARSLLRNGLKVALPWELGHTAAFTLAAPSAAGPAALAASVCGIAACVIAGGYAVSLFIGSGRMPYDLLAGTSVHRSG